MSLIYKGDLDNRLKTLFDSLRYPEQPNELPPDAYPADNEKNPFYVLLENDRSITAFNVKSERLLIPRAENEPEEYVELYIDIKVKALGDV